MLFELYIYWTKGIYESNRSVDQKNISTTLINNYINNTLGRLRERSKLFT